MTALDALLDHIERGGTLTVYWEPRSEVCQFPLYSALTSYNRGCRCARCHEAKMTHRHTQQERWRP